MKYVLTVVAVMVLLVPASALAAGENPGAKIFVTFTSPTLDNASVVSRADPVQYTAFSAYLGMTDLTMGMTSVSFKMSFTPGMVSPPSMVNLLPGDLAIGNWADGITLAATQCMNTDEGREFIDPVIFARFDLFYLGVPGDVTFLDHPDFPRWVLDCNDPAVVDYFCIWSHGGVAKDPEPGDVGCEADTPVEALTWGAIKALYN